VNHEPVSWRTHFRNVSAVQPSYEHRRRAEDPDRRPARAKRDEQLRPHIQRVWNDNHGMYGADMVWRQLGRENIDIARCTVERVMRDMGLRGATRDRAFKVTPRADENAFRPPDLVHRELVATRPNQLWVADIPLRIREGRLARTRGRRVRRSVRRDWVGFAYVAFVVDVSRVASSAGGCRARSRATSRSMRSSRRCTRGPMSTASCTIATAARSARRFATPSVSLQRASNARSAASAARTTTPSPGPSTACTRPRSFGRGPWRNVDDVEYATLVWVD